MRRRRGDHDAPGGLSIAAARHGAVEIGPGNGPAGRRAERILDRLSEGRAFGPVLLLPGILLVGAVVLYPAVYGLGLSLVEMRPNRPDLGTSFVGLDQYRALAADPAAWSSLATTVVWVAAAITIELALGLATALAIDRGLPGTRLFAALIVLPYFLPGIVAGHMWALLLDPGAGLVGEGRAWLADPATALAAVILVECWHGFPFFTILFVAALRQVPRHLLEAAALDGAGPSARLLHVVLPSLRTVIAASLILRVVFLVNSPDLVFVLTNGGPGRATETLAVFAFRKAYAALDFGAAAALGVIMLLLLAGLAAALARMLPWQGGMRHG